MDSRLRGNDDWGQGDGASLGAGGWHLEHLAQLACAESSVGNGSDFAGMTMVVEAGFLFGFWAVSCVMGSENAGLFAGGWAELNGQRLSYVRISWCIRLGTESEFPLGCIFSGPMRNIDPVKPLDCTIG
jgi:hypothetical protein